MTDYLDAHAEISSDGLYRYELTRRWGTGKLGALWMMLNPSTADGEVDDPTIRRCVGFTKREGLDHLKVVNLYALRVTKPEHLDDHPDPVGPLNRDFLAEATADPRFALLMAAWGADPGPRTIWIPKRFWYCLGRTRNGQPRHPLYVRADAPITRWWMLDIPG